MSTFDLFLTFNVIDICVMAVCPDSSAMLCPTCTASSREACTAVEQLSLCNNNYVSVFHFLITMS